MSEEVSAKEKLQREYNEACSLYGHCKSQIIGLEDQLQSLEDRMRKVMKKAANLPQQKAEEAAAESAAPVAEVKEGEA